MNRNPSEEEFKMKFETPTMEITRFSAGDVITASANVVYYTPGDSAGFNSSAETSVEIDCSANSFVCGFN